MALSSELKAQLESLIASDRVVLFMKGTREQPQCGFSATVINILDEFLANYTTVNVLADPVVRDGIKMFSSWPTIPQLYVDKEFIGGCDIVRELFQSGDLFDILKIKRPEPGVALQISMTSAAIDAFKNALEDASEGEYLRLKIDAAFENHLSFGAKQANDIEIFQNGILVLIDALSATRANGITIDFKKSAQGSGFEITNPNAPPPVKQMTVQELKEKMDRGETLHLFDVRTRDEWQQGRINGAKLMLDIPKETMDMLNKEQPIIFHCRSGGRSQKTAEQFRKQGFTNVYNLKGGIRAWSSEIDPAVPVY